MGKMKKVYIFTFFRNFDIINDKKKSYIGYMTILTIYSRSLDLIGEKAGAQIYQKCFLSPEHVWNKIQ